MFSVRKDVGAARQNNRRTHTHKYTRILETYTRNLIWYVHTLNRENNYHTQLHKQNTQTHSKNVTQTNRNALTKRETKQWQRIQVKGTLGLNVC